MSSDVTLRPYQQEAEQASCMNGTAAIPKHSWSYQQDAMPSEKQYC